MSNQKYTKTDRSAQAVVLLCRAETLTGNNDRDKPAGPSVPITAELPILPEFRRWLPKHRAESWHVTLTIVVTIGLMLAIACAGCGLGGSMVSSPVLN